MLPLSKTELEGLDKKLSTLDKKIPERTQELENYETLFKEGKEGKIGKRDYNRLVKKAQKDIESYIAQKEALESKIELGEQGLPADE